VFVRWDGQTVEADEQARLPGHAGTAVVRRFDAPEALETRFYEVRAKSALNKVPAKSRVPFSWTVNPYRGCSHACSYCLWGNTLVLLGDGRTREIRHLRPGDQVFGTVRRGHYRRYVRTEVLDHWMVRKPAYRVTLEDGTELITSADHRFLTGRGWKHVIGAESGPMQRPHLTLNGKLMGTGAFEEPPVETRDYKRGYLCAMVRGDGYLSMRLRERSNGRLGQQKNQFRLALVDFEALARTQCYLDELRVETRSFRFAARSERRHEMHAIGATSRFAVKAISQLIAWPRRTTIDWYKGFLAGIFDAEGTFSCGVVRIANSDPTIIDWTTFACRRLGLPFVIENVREGMWNVRIRGGLEQQLRFHHLTNPAITRKRSIEGRAVKSQSRLRVVSIEPLGMELPLYDITTGTGDFIANGVVSHNCFARPTHEYLDMNAGRDFEKEIVVKVNVPEVLRAELARPSWKREHVAMGTNTDPYQWVEGRYKLMRGIWEALRDAANPCSILTKSPLLLRDVDLMREVAARAEISACLSVPTLDEKAWRASEPHTPHPRARLEAVGELNRAGIPTGILIAPLMPGINDAPEQIERIIELATEAGAVSIGGQTLFLRGSVREIFFGWLRSYRPDLVPRYERLYARGAYVPQRERRAIERAAGLPGFRERNDPERFKHRGGSRRREPPPARREEVRQERLF
jgi:DNA repair photolyase